MFMMPPSKLSNFPRAMLQQKKLLKVGQMPSGLLVRLKWQKPILSRSLRLKVRSIPTISLQLVMPGVVLTFLCMLWQWVKPVSLAVLRKLPSGVKKAIVLLLSGMLLVPVLPVSQLVIAYSGISVTISQQFRTSVVVASLLVG